MKLAACLLCMLLAACGNTPKKPKVPDESAPHFTINKTMPAEIQTGSTK